MHTHKLTNALLHFALGSLVLALGGIYKSTIYKSVIYKYIIYKSINLQSVNL